MNRQALGAGVFLALVAVGGLVMLLFGWVGVSGTLDVSNEMAYLVSGGIGGLALVIVGCALFTAHVERYDTETERAALDRVLTHAAGLVDERFSVPPPPRPRRRTSRSQKAPTTEVAR